MARIYSEQEQVAMAKAARTWTLEGDDRYVRFFGPIKAIVTRCWRADDKEPSHYYGFFEIGSFECLVRISELGVEWFDDDCGKRACKAVEKMMKDHIRTWLK